MRTSGNNGLTANAWFQAHWTELKDRCQTFFRYPPYDAREEASAETIAMGFQYAVRAERRGVLARLTHYTLVSYFGHNVRRGRKLCGSTREDVHGYRDQHRIRVESLSQPIPTPEGDDYCTQPSLADALCARSAGMNSPLENARRNLDYPYILEHESASRKVRRVLVFFYETRGTGLQKDLARELHVSQPRVTQLKHQLANCLAAHDYAPASCHGVNGGDMMRRVP